ncbi:L-threonylcarbamoyladenylate synthase [Terriglobus aquaticus]|uniref:Threonylcarbamoyl-AMP synthase n=1 Tax=Terriglobus aquaticus TaxID=940139 RepID=A0ABW9KJ84_9BACT
MTLRLDCSAQSIAIAATLLRNGGLVAMPTETVYGLAANALDASAVGSIFAAKGRPHWDPLIVHIASTAMLNKVAAEISATAQLLADAFWPGPLTMLLPRAEGIGDSVTAGRALVGVRWPQHPVAQTLILAAELPLAAPSANRFGHISPSTAAHVLHDLDGRIDAVLDGGPTGIGVESTVLDPNTTPITIYRQGAVSAADVERVTGVPVQLFQPEPNRSPQSLPSPGVGIRHYAPRTPLRLVESRSELLEEIAAASQPVAVLRPQDWAIPTDPPQVSWGAWDDTAQLAHGLYAALRELDRIGSSLILAPLPDARAGDDLRSAVRDRLLKAAMPAEDDRQS